MPIEVEGPDGVIVEFPDGTDSATMERAMSQKFPKPQAAAPVPAPSAPTSAESAPARTSMDQIGMGTRGLLTGAGSLIDVIAGPLNATINALPGKQGLSTAPFAELGRDASNYFGLEAPVTNTEKMHNALIEGGSQAVLSGGIGNLLKGAQGITGMLGTALAEGPIAELVGSMTGNAAAEKAGQEGYGPVAQMLAGLGVGVASGVGTSVAGSALKARPDGLTGTVTDESPATPPVYRKAELSPEEMAEYTRVHAEGTADEIFDYMKSIGSVDENTADTIAKYVAARDAGKPVGTGVNYIDPNADPAAAKLAGEAEAFRPSREPTTEDLFPTEESRARKLAETEARLQQEATDFQARQKPEATPAFDAPAAAKAVEDTRVEIAGHMSGWKNAPDYHVVNKLDDLDEADRALMDPSAAAAVMPDGRVVFNRENIRSPEHLKAAVFHEMLGHHGLTRRFGAVLDDVIKKIIDSSPDFKARVDEWLTDNPDIYADAPDRVIRAGDEVFAQMSEAGVIPLTVMNRIKNAVKDFLRAAGVKNIEYSPREIETILALAHDAIINGKPRDVAGNGFKLPARFMYVGRQAGNDSDMYQRQTAEDLYEDEVMTPEQIRQDTGWFRGPEGKMRTEISDFGARLTQILPFLDDGRIKELTLDRVLDHPALYEAYPELKNVKVVAETNPNNRGSFDESTQTLYIAGPSKFSSEKQRLSTILHEVQHWVQAKEGFLRGSNDTAVISQMSERQYKEFLDYHKKEAENIALQFEDSAEGIRLTLKYPHLPSLLEAIRTKDRGGEYDAIIYEEERRAFFEDILQADWTKSDASLPDSAFTVWSTVLGEVKRPGELEARLKAQSEIAADARKDAAEMSSKYGKNRRLAMAHFGESPPATRAYRNSFGEIEARDTQARMDMDEYDRYTTQPYSSSDSVPTKSIVMARGWDPLDPAFDAVSADKDPPARFMREPYQKKSTSAESMRTVNDVDGLLSLLDGQNEAIKADPATMAEVKRQADDLGLTPSQYARGKGLDELPARIMAAHQVLTNTVDELAGLGAKAQAEGMSPTLHATILEKLAVVQAVYGRFDNDASAVGRALRTLKEVSESRKSAAAAARFMAESGGAALAKDPVALQKFLGTLDAVRQTQGSAAAANAIRKAGKYHVEDYASSVVFNFMLSSPLTWAKNAVGAPVNFGMDMISDGLGAIIGQTSKIPGLAASTDRVMGREMMARLHGSLAAFANWPTYAAIGNALKRGESTHAGLTGKTGTRGLPLSSNKNPLVRGAGAVVEIPQRVMAAIDETWAGVFQMSNLYGEAAKQAASEGLTGKAYSDRFRELADNPSEAMLEKAHEITNRQLFRDHDQMSRLARWITDAQTPRFADETQITMQKDVDGKLRPVSKTVVEKDSPAIRGTKFASRLALPFVPTIDSIARTVLRNTPVSALATALRSTGRERQAAMGRLVASSAVFGYFAMMAAEGNLTGVESPDRDEQATIGAARPPLSIKIGDEWVSYQGFDPIAAPMAMAATSVDRHNKGENTSEAMLGGITGLADALSKSTYMDSAFQLVTMIQEAAQSATDGKPLGPTVRNFLAGYGATLATPAGVRWANQKFNDPALRDTTADTGVLGRMGARAQAGWPGLSEDLPQRHDVFGRPQLNQRQDRMVEKDPIVNEVVRLEELSDELLLGPVDREVKVGDSEGKVKLDAVQYQAYQKLAGEYLMSDLRDEMATAEWSNYSDEEKIEVIKEIKEAARADARADLFAEVETAE